MTDEYQWYYLGSDDVPQGPVGREQLLELIRQGHARQDALVWRDGFSGWRPYWDVPELQKPGASSDAQPAAAQPSAARPAARDQVQAAPGKAGAAQSGSGATVTSKAAVSKTASPKSSGPKQALPTQLASQLVHAPLEKIAAVVRKRPHVERSHLMVGFGFAALAVIIVSGLYSYSSPKSSDAPPIMAVLEQPQAYEPMLEEIPVPEDPEQPVRVRNPFDASEVFEFPPGTSEADAREAVADFLLQRATERRATMPSLRKKPVSSSTKKAKQTSTKKSSTAQKKKKSS